jgi:arabinose-5-phosphate isomerase
MNARTAAPPVFEAGRAIVLAQETLGIEAAAVMAVRQRLGPAFAQAVERMLLLSGRVVVMGMGKSGHIGRKIAATLASTGTPALFVHPAEASHGDLGMITAADLVLAVSNSGESQELTTILPVFKRLGVPLVAMTGRADSTLARYADVFLDCAVDKEACPLNLTPTASTTVQLALGDALAVALLDARGFKAEDFAVAKFVGPGKKAAPAAAAAAAAPAKDAPKKDGADATKKDGAVKGKEATPPAAAEKK